MTGNAAGWTGLGRFASRILAGCFVLYGLVFAAFFAVNMPPFQNADETAHVFRAAQIAQGGLVGVRFSEGVSGGMVDRGLTEAALPFAPVTFHQDVKATAAMYAAAGALRWTGDRQKTVFSNTAVYSPVFYLPAAMGLWLGRTTGLTILQSLTLARFANAVVAIALGAAGIVLAGQGAPILFALLCLPMSLALMANVSQDGGMLGCCALAAGLACAARDGTRMAPGWLLALLSVAVGLVCVARPPYLPLAVLPLLVPAGSRGRRVAATLSIVAATLAWSAFAASRAMGDLRPDHPQANAGEQVRWMAGHAAELVPILVRSVRTDAAGLLEGFTGRLGWMDVPLPQAYPALAFAVLLLAALGSVGRATPRSGSASHGVGKAAILAAAALASAVLIELVQFVTWTDVGASLVAGVQGRYVLPVAILLVPALSYLAGLAPSGWNGSSRVRAALVAGVALFPVISTGLVMRAVVQRYFI